MSGCSNGIMTRAELAALGASDAWIYRQIQRGLLAYVGSGLYRVHPDGQPLNPDQRRRIAIEHGSRDSLVDRYCAAVAHDVWPADRAPRGIVHVATASHVRSLDHQGISYRRVSPEYLHDHACLLDGMPTTDLVGTCADIGTVASPWQTTYVMDRACRWHGLDVAVLGAHVDERRTGHGMAASRAGLDLMRANSIGTRSGAEDLLVHMVVGRTERPLLINVRGVVPELPDYEPDFIDVVTHRIVEVDGTFHLDDEQAERDRVRDAHLLELGIPVLRIPSWEVYRRPRMVLRVVLEFLLASGPVQPVEIPSAHTYAWNVALRRKLRAQRRGLTPARGT